MKTNTVMEALRKARAITNEDALRNATEAAQQARWAEELDREERALRRRMVDGQVERDEALIKRVKARDAKARAEKAQQARWDEAEARKARAKARAEKAQVSTSNQ